MRGSGEAGLGACLTHGRGELRSSRKEGTKNGVKGRLGRGLKGASDIPSAFSCFYLFISYPGILKRDEPPLETEKIVSKDDVNAFRNTGLLAHLNENKVKRLVICGMMTHMCVEAATRAAHDYGFECALVHDACATRALKFNEIEIPAEAVHNSTLASLSGYYARVVDTETCLKEVSH